MSRTRHNDSCKNKETQHTPVRLRCWRTRRAVCARIKHTQHKSCVLKERVDDSLGVGSGAFMMTIKPTQSDNRAILCKWKKTEESESLRKCQAAITCAKVSHFILSDISGASVRNQFNCRE